MMMMMMIMMMMIMPTVVFLRVDESGFNLSY